MLFNFHFEIGGNATSGENDRKEEVGLKCEMKKWSAMECK